MRSRALNPLGADVKQAIFGKNPLMRFLGALGFERSSHTSG
jgi:hypothetical protein